MKRFKEEQEQVDPLELVTAAFCRMGNFPKGLKAQQFLAQGLAKASKASGVAMAEIVDNCLGTSEFCPTDADMLQVAQSLCEPKPGWDPRRPVQCDRCQDSGWQSFERNGVDVAAYCPCSAGQALKAAEQKRRAKIAERKIEASK